MGCLKLTYHAEPELKVSYFKKELTLKSSAENAGSYLKARYYAPWTCRFISVDPLAADYPYLTPYNYAGNKPITHKDIDGLQSTGDEPVSGGGGNQQNGNSQGNNTTTQNTQVHSVEKGDTLSGLAQKYGTTVDKLRELNPQTQNRKQADQINIGEKLNIQDYNNSSSPEMTTNWHPPMSLPKSAEKPYTPKSSLSFTGPSLILGGKIMETPFPKTWLNKPPLNSIAGGYARGWTMGSRYTSIGSFSSRILGLGGEFGRLLPARLNAAGMAWTFGEALYDYSRITTDKSILQQYNQNQLKNPYRGFVIDGFNMLQIDYKAIEQRKQEQKQKQQEIKSKNPYRGFVIKGGLFD